MKTQNLLYKIKRFLLWESGIIEKVEEYSIDNKEEVSINFYPLKDDFGNHPQKVTFRNPLGELKIDYAVEEKVKVGSPLNYAFRYRRYKVGDKFP